jgi:hypothetical protein
MADQSNKQPACESMPEQAIDETLKVSFPASDQPQWTLRVENHCDDPKKMEPGDSTERECS